MKNDPHRPAENQPPRSVEDRVRERIDSIRKMVPEEVAKLLYEHEMRAMELQMQNAELRASRQEAEATRNRYADLYDIAPFGYLMLDDRGCIQEINLTALRMLEADRRTLLGLRLGTLVVTEDRRSFSAHLRRCTEGTDYVITDLHLRGLKGSVTRVQLCSNRATSPEGGTWYPTALTAIPALTEAEQEQKLLARELKQRIIELQALLDILPVAVWISHDKACRNVVGNLYADQLLGATRSRDTSATAAPAEGAVTYRVFRRGAELAPEEMPALRAAATGKPVMHEEIDFLFADGRLVNMLCSAVPLMDETGSVRGMVATGADVTQLKHAETTVQCCEARLRQALEMGRLAMWDRNITDDSVTWNDEVFRILGYAPGEVTAGHKAWIDRVHPEDRARVEALVQRYMEQGENYRMEYRTLWPDGSVHWIEALGQCTLDAAGRPAHFYGMLLEITDRRPAAADIPAAIDSNGPVP